MYAAFKHSHSLTAVLSVLFTLAWTFVAWRGAAPSRAGLVGRNKFFYVGNRVTAGLAGVTGIGVTFVGPWQYMVFPYIGLAAFVVHGIAATWSKRAFVSHGAASPRAALVLQSVALLVAAYVMVVKPA